MLCTSELYELREELNMELSEVNLERYELDPEFGPDGYDLYLDHKAEDLKRRIDEINAVLLPLEELI